MKKTEGGKQKVRSSRLSVVGCRLSVDRRVRNGTWKRWLFCLLPSAVCLLPAAFAQQAKTTSGAANVQTGPLTYDSFKLIHTRNVFDPDRRPLRPTNSAPPSGRADYVALTGLMVDTNKSSAFFSGSKPEFNKVLTVGEKIANSTIREITAQNIVVERDSDHKRTTVPVGRTVPLDAKAVPEVAPANYADVASAAAPAGSVNAGATSPGGDSNDAAAAPAPGAAPATGTTTAGGNPPTGGKSPASLEEIKRRMMERRNQDMK